MDSIATVMQSIDTHEDLNDDKDDEDSDLNDDKDDEDDDLLRDYTDCLLSNVEVMNLQRGDRIDHRDKFGTIYFCA